MTTQILTRKGSVLETPSIINMLFNDKRSSILWLIVRVWLGYQWINAGLQKVTNPAWMQTGVALKGFWMGAVKIPTEGHPPVAYDWYRNFLQFMLDSNAYVWFAKVVAISEMAFGILLILGIFVGFTAFSAGFMNWNFIMAGSASVNGIFFGLSVFLVLAWKVAGYIGLDYFILPRLGDLWSPAKVNNE